MTDATEVKEPIKEEESAVITPTPDMTEDPAGDVTVDPATPDGGHVVSTAEEPVISARTFDWDAINSDAVASESYVPTGEMDDVPLSDEDELEIDGEDLVMSESYVPTGADIFTPTAQGAIAETTGLGDSFIPPPTRGPIPDIADDNESFCSEFSDIGALEEEKKDPPPDLVVISNKEAFESLKNEGSRMVEHEGEKWIVWENNQCVHSKALSGWFSKIKDKTSKTRKIAYDLGSLWWFLEGLNGRASVDRQTTEEEGYTFIDVKDRAGLIKRLKPPVEEPKSATVATLETKLEEESAVVVPPEEEVERTPSPKLTEEELAELEKKKQQEAAEQFEREYQQGIQNEIERAAAQEAEHETATSVHAPSPAVIEEAAYQDDDFDMGAHHTPSPGPDADDVAYSPSAHEPSMSKTREKSVFVEKSRAERSRAERSRAFEASVAEPSTKRQKTMDDMDESERAYEHFMATTWSLKVTEMRTPLSKGDNHVSDILQLARSTLKTWQEDEKRRNSKSDRRNRRKGTEDSAYTQGGENTEFSTIMRNAVEPPRPAEGTRLEQLMSIHSYLGGYEHGEPPAAIIVLPNNRNALINMLNIEEFIGASKFELLSDGQRTLQMWSNRKRKVVFRRTVRNVPIRFEFTDGTKQFYSDEWQKVVGVLCDGQSWQFKDWPFRSHVDLFVAIQGFHLKFQNDPKPASMAKWNVKELSIQKLSRHEDPTVVDLFWDVIDDYLLGRNRISLLDMNSRLK